MNDIGSFVRAYGSVAMFILMASNGILSTPPSEAVLAAGGALVATGYISFLSTAGAAVAGNLTGALVLYYFGRKVGYSWVQSARSRALASRIPRYLVDIVFPDARAVEALDSFLRHRRSAWIGVLRCLPLVRSVVSIPAGMSGMSLVPFTTWSFVGIMIWAMFWIGLGYFFGANWKHIGNRVSFILAVAVCIVVLLALRRIKSYYS